MSENGTMEINLHGSGKLTDALIPKAQKKLPNFKAMMTLAILNGALYYAIAIDGGDNAESFLNLHGELGDIIILALSAGASIVYTMFMYKTLESLTLKVDSISKAFFTILAPFSAASFLTAGTEGAEILHFGPGAALAIGILLFLLRNLNNIDASVKFPNRLKETLNAWAIARRDRDAPELCRLIVVWLASIIYVVCATDAIFNASETLFSWFGIKEDDSYAVNFLFSMMGALGTLPLNVYWSHRGLRQLTFGGKPDEDGHVADPTDKYTYWGALCVIPVILGILGGVTASSGKMFGQIGEASQALRVISSIMYGLFAGTPGMASLLRSAQRYRCNFFPDSSAQDQVHDRHKVVADIHDEAQGYEKT